MYGFLCSFHALWCVHVPWEISSVCCARSFNARVWNVTFRLVHTLQDCGVALIVSDYLIFSQIFSSLEPLVHFLLIWARNEIMVDNKESYKCARVSAASVLITPSSSSPSLIISRMLCAPCFNVLRLFCQSKSAALFSLQPLALILSCSIQSISAQTPPPLSLTHKHRPLLTVTQLRHAFCGVRCTIIVSTGMWWILLVGC